MNQNPNKNKKILIVGNDNPPIMTQITAFKKGQEAYRNGYYEDANPYVNHTDDFMAWEDGWKFEFKKNYHDEDGAF